MEIPLGETVYKIKIKWTQTSEIFGDRNKDLADLYRDLILTCVEELELTKEQVEEMDTAIFMKLGAEITKLQGDLKNFQDIANLSRR